MTEDVHRERMRLVLADRGLSPLSLKQKARLARQREQFLGRENPLEERVDVGPESGASPVRSAPRVPALLMRNIFINNAD